VIALHVLVAAVLVVGGTLLALSIAIVVNKAVRDGRERAFARRRARLEPPLLAVIHADEPVDAGGSGNGKPPAVSETAAASLPEETYHFDLALGILGNGDRRVVEKILMDHAVRTNGVARHRITQAFEELGFVNDYLQGLGAQRWWRRADSAERLGLARSARSTDPLIARMNDPVSEVRLRAAKALGQIRGKGAVAPLLTALARPDRWSTVRIADILGGMGEEAAEGLIAAWPALLGGSRLACLDVLGKLRRPEAIEFLIGILRDGMPDERARAAHALGRIGHPRPVPALVAALQDPDWPVVAMAAKALGAIGALDAVEPLSRAMRHKEWWVRANAAAALKAMGLRGRQALLDVLDDTDAYARQQAVLMLQESGALAQAVIDLESNDEKTRAQADALVRKLMALGRTDSLIDMAREHPNFRVRVKLDRILEGEQA
jgi:HEAT repeat protein